MTQTRGKAGPVHDQPVNQPKTTIARFGWGRHPRCEASGAKGAGMGGDSRPSPMPAPGQTYGRKRVLTTKPSLYTE
jgi:hypothetical protein